jgi:hypothetical protein
MKSLLHNALCRCKRHSGTVKLEWSNTSYIGVLKSKPSCIIEKVRKLRTNTLLYIFLAVAQLYSL